MKDLQELKLVGRKLGPLAVGDEAELWAWEAAVLEHHGIVASVQKPTVAELRKLILAEERSSGPATLPHDFYLSVAREISALRAVGDTENADRLRAQTLALAEIRLPKLVRFALSPEQPSGLSLEEHFLVNRLAELFEGWSERLSESFGEAKEEVEKHDVGGSLQHVARDEADIQKPGVSAP